MSSIHECAAKNDVQGINKCLDQGISVNAVDELNRTPLIFAARNNSIEAAKLLISKGADVNIYANDEEMQPTAFLYCSKNGHKEIFHLCLPTANFRITNRFGG